MKQLFKTKIGATPIEQVVFFGGETVTQIDQFGKYVDTFKTEEKFVISKVDLEKAKSIFTNPKIKVSGTQVIFKEGKNKVKFLTVAFEDTTIEIDFKGEFKDLHEDFYETIKKAVQYSGNGDVRKILNGVNISKDKVSSTNSFKLYSAVLEGMDVKDININRDVVSLLEGMKSINQSDHATTFTNENKDKFLILREFHDSYPDISSLTKVPEGFERVKFDNRGLEDALTVAIKLGVEKIQLSNNKITSYKSEIEFEQDIDMDINISIVLSVKTIKGALISGELSYKDSRNLLAVSNGHEISIVLPLRY